MASIIDTTYFRNDISIPDSDYSTLQLFIDKFEPIILTKLLGYTLYKAMLAAPSEQRFDRLINGYEYSTGTGDSLRYIKWNGFANSELISVIAYYVYYYYLRDKASINTTSGIAVALLENATIDNSQLKPFAAWNKLRELYGYCGQDILKPSCSNFLSEHVGDYPEWDFEDIGSVNSFDL